MGPMLLICDDGLEMCIWEGYRQFHCLFSLDPLWLEKYKLTLDEIVFSYLSGSLANILTCRRHYLDY